MENIKLYSLSDKAEYRPTDCMSYDWLHRLNHKEVSNG